MFAQIGVAWLLTYLLHSTLFLGLAWLVSRRLARWSAPAEEAVWRFALVAALATATLQLAAGWEPLGGRWGLPQTPAALEVTAEPIAAPALPRALRSAEPGQRFAAPVLTVPEASSLPVMSPTGIALGFWALGALLLIARLGQSFFRLGRRLQGRPRVVGGTLFSQLDRLAAEAGLDQPVRLSCSSRLPVPIALGLGQPEICVPPRALVGLTAEQQEGLLAHELGHLARRDPLWLVVSQLVTAVLFFQPLNWVASRRMREISELLSDEWAVRRTGRPVSLARCLAEVAGWSLRPAAALPTPGMADRPSHLAHRIRRLLDEARSPERPVRRAWLGVAMVVLLLAVVAAAPVVSAAARSEAAEAVAAVEPVSPVEPQEPQEPEEPRAAAEPEDDDFEHEHEHEFEHDEEFEFEHEFEHEFDFEFDMAEEELEAITESALGIVETTLDSLDFDHLEDLAELGQLAELSEMDLQGIDKEVEKAVREAERYAEDAERAAEEIERSIQPELERMEREIDSKVKSLTDQMNSPEMKRLQAEMEKMGERMRPSDEEMERLHAEAEKLREKHGSLSREERDRLRDEARRLAEQSRPSEEERQAMRELQRKYREEHRRVMDEHRGEIEAMRREIQLQSQALSEQVRRKIAENPRLRDLESRERELERAHALRDRAREKAREEREKRREEIERRRDESRERRREDPNPNPQPRPEPKPRVSVKVDPKVEVEVKPEVRVEVREGSGSF